MRFQKGCLIALSSRKVKNFIGIIGHGIPSSDEVFQRAKNFTADMRTGVNSLDFCSTYYVPTIEGM